MMCEDMTIENSFIGSLDKVVGYKFKGADLVLLSNENEELMVLELNKE